MSKYEAIDDDNKNHKGDILMLQLMEYLRKPLIPFQIYVFTLKNALLCFHIPGKMCIINTRLCWECTNDISQLANNIQTTV